MFILFHDHNQPVCLQGEPWHRYGDCSTQTLEYPKRNTPVFCCFMDMSKAFDRVSHSELQNVLLKRGVPKYIVCLLRNWYSEQRMSVRWGSTVSSEFTVSCGVKQGSKISPHLFNLYMDDLSSELNQCKVGCVVNNRIVNHLLYADDIVVFSPSVTGLQDLVKKCSNYISSKYLTLNNDKTKCMLFTNNRNYFAPPTPVVINDINIEYVHEIKYLGYMFTHNNRDDRHIESLYRGMCVRSNMVLRNFKKCTTDVKCLLLKSFCTSFYCISLIFNYNATKLNRLRVCYNNCLRKLFNLPFRGSVSALCVRHGIPTFAEVRRKAVVGLLGRLQNSDNALINSFMNFNFFQSSVIYRSWRTIAYV